MADIHASDPKGLDDPYYVFKEYVVPPGRVEPVDARARCSVPARFVVVAGWTTLHVRLRSLACSDGQIQQ